MIMSIKRLPLLFPTNFDNLFIIFHNFEGLKRSNRPDAENKRHLELLVSFSFPSKEKFLFSSLKKKKEKRKGTLAANYIESR